MARALDDVKRDILRAYAAKDVGTLKTLLGEYQTRKASAARSQANIAADTAAMGPDVSGNNFLAGAGRNMAKDLGQLLQLATPKKYEKALDTSLVPVSDEARAEMERQTAPLMATRSGKVGGFVGDVAATAPIAGVAGGLTRGALTRLGTAVAPEGATAKALLELTKLPKYARYGGWAAEGAAGQAATTGEVTPGGIVTGMLGGRAGDALGDVTNAAVRGLRRSPGSDVLLSYGADLTPGGLRPEGFWNSLEQTVAVSPILGPGIRKAREEATKEVVPNLIADIARVPRQPGTTVREAAQRLGRRTSALYGKPKPIKPPRLADLNDFKATAQRAIKQHGPTDTAAVEAQLTSVWARLRQAKTTGEVKGILSDLRATARELNYGGKGTVARREQARVYADMAKWLDAYYKRPMKAIRRGMVTRADEITAQYKPIEGAIAASFKKGAQKPPAGVDLLKSLAKSRRQGEFVRGDYSGPTEQVAEALAEHQVGQQARGGIERVQVLRDLLALGAWVPAKMAASPISRRVAQGATRPQEALQTLLERPVIGKNVDLDTLLRALYNSQRRGIPGAVSEARYEEPQ